MSKWRDCGTSSLKCTSLIGRPTEDSPLLQRLRAGLGHSGLQGKEGEPTAIRGRWSWESAPNSPFSPSSSFCTLGRYQTSPLVVQSIIGSASGGIRTYQQSLAHRLFFILRLLYTPHLPSPPLPAPVGGATWILMWRGKTSKASFYGRSRRPSARTILGFWLCRRAPGFEFFCRSAAGIDFPLLHQS
ncbi:hypothetical protein MPH_10680 [Macrophomina phaseolina MS6]|uniref:Uncharacterized protein n=1 Tax=Macrophomina phaseolina (strain MS6) TaxID=1126212 RepID=K2RH36_MACPH|nr:hypothetical protein MPH_10680 [Macrophomina phaseolina MS6]